MSKAENFIHYLEEYFNTSDNDELEQELFEECVKNKGLEKENIVLQERIKELEKQVNDLCPVGDLVGFPAWQVEKAHMMDNIAKLEIDRNSWKKAHANVINLLEEWWIERTILMERLAKITYDFITEEESG